VTSSNRVPGFSPSVSALHFDNAADQLRGKRFPVVTLPVVGPIRASAAGGICGGFVFTVLDLFRHHPRLAPPPDIAVPDEGTALFRYLGRRFADSWGPVAYGNAVKAIDWVMAQTGDSGIHLIPGLGRRMATREWPAIKADIDAGRPSPLYLVMAPQGDPVIALGHSHQIAAYGYDVASNGKVVLHVYDPNDNADDGSVVRLDLSDPARGVPISAPQIEERFLHPEPIRGVFRADYAPADPASLRLQPMA
jgi:hypothetical protein